MSDSSLISEEIRPELLADNSFTLAIRDASDNFTYEVRNIDDPYSLDANRFIPNSPICYEQFVSLASDVIDDAQDRASTVASQRVSLAKDYNPEAFAEFDEIITIKILNRSPANMSTDGKSRKVRGMRPSYEYMDPSYPNKVLEIQNRPIDHKIEFCAWGKTSTLADARALWIERLFIKEAWVFRSKGASLFYWNDRGPDTFWQHGGARLHQRPLYYKLRLHEYTVVSHPTIKQFDLSLKNIIPE